MENISKIGVIVFLLTLLLIILILPVHAQSVTRIEICDDGEMRCMGDSLQKCDGNSWETLIDCDYQCWESPEPHCVEKSKVSFYVTLIIIFGILFLVIGLLIGKFVLSNKKKK